MPRTIFHSPTLLFLLLLFCLITGCASLKAPRFESVENIAVSKIRSARTTLRLDLRLHNPNKGKIRVKGIAGEAWLQDRRLGEFRSDSILRIQGPGFFTLPLVLELDNKKLVPNTLEALFSPRLKLRVKGKARAGKAGLFVTIPLEFSSELTPEQLGF